MYVIRSARRTGVGGALLAHLERTAADLGFRVMRLETGKSPASRDGIVRVLRFRSYSTVRRLCE
jgi:GNAT superfamily N-acetyltransferase